MYIEETLAQLSEQLNSLALKVERIQKILETSKSIDNAEFLSINQICECKFWPYTASATRKMITREKLIEGYHYYKFDGKIICSVEAFKNYMKNKFVNKRSA